ncbi:unnamed protein product, partial [Laminaria digitata]
PHLQTHCLFWELHNKGRRYYEGTVSEQKHTQSVCYANLLLPSPAAVLSLVAGCRHGRRAQGVPLPAAISPPKADLYLGTLLSGGLVLASGMASSDYSLRAGRGRAMVPWCPWPAWQYGGQRPVRVEEQWTAAVQPGALEVARGW